jgi:hypothetical protein
MSAIEWKPGDLALVTYHQGFKDAEVVMRADDRSSREWISPSVVRGSRLRPDVWVSNARRLVVVDPEDREQVARLRRHLADLVSMSQLREALNDYANRRPEIEEPTGLGAVVEDENGCRWVRCGGRWDRDDGNAVALSCDWVDVDAVKVLSEGVTT